MGTGSWARYRSTSVSAILLGVWQPDEASSPLSTPRTDVCLEFGVDSLGRREVGHVGATATDTGLANVAVSF